MEMKNDVLQNLWKCEKEILDVIDQFCSDHNICYSLFYGTLLGAVRHKGFIPWDDDIDIVMPRQDYDRFIALWHENPVDGYLLQTPYSEGIAYSNNFSKLRKNNTAFIQLEEEYTTTYHTGIFVDIFPMDHAPDGRIARKIQYCFAAINLLYSRGYTSGTGGVTGIIERILLKVPRKRHFHFRDQAEKVLKHWNHNNHNNMEYVASCTIRDAARYYPADLFSNVGRIQFEGKQYACTSEATKVLAIRYGNYLELPPEEERVWKHQPLYIDFEHNYE